MPGACGRPSEAEEAASKGKGTALDPLALRVGCHFDLCSIRCRQAATNFVDKFGSLRTGHVVLDRCPCADVVGPSPPTRRRGGPNLDDAIRCVPVACHRDRVPTGPQSRTRRKNERNWSLPSVDVRLRTIRPWRLARRMGPRAPAPPPSEELSRKSVRPSRLAPCPGSRCRVLRARGDIRVSGFRRRREEELGLHQDLRDACPEGFEPPTF